MPKCQHSDWHGLRIETIHSGTTVYIQPTTTWWERHGNRTIHNHVIRVYMLVCAPLFPHTAIPCFINLQVNEPWKPHIVYIHAFITSTAPAQKQALFTPLMGRSPIWSCIPLMLCRYYRHPLINFSLWSCFLDTSLEHPMCRLLDLKRSCLLFPLHF